jgi:hypothetical protein
MNILKKLIWPVIFVLVLIAPKAGATEWYGDVTLGIGFTDAENGGIRQNAVVTRPMESSDTSTPAGLRMGFWLEHNPWLGFAGDIFLFTPNFNTPGMDDDIDLTVMPLSVLVLVRLKPLSNVGSTRTWTPYLGGGPGYFFSSMSEFAGASVPSPAVIEDSSMDFGWTGIAGISWRLSEKLSALFEYRYTQISPSLSSSHSSGTLRFEPDLTSHHFLLGIRIHF